MKHFIRIFKQEQTNLLNQIKANGLPVGSVNGIPLDHHGLKYSEAQEIIKNEKAYLKESGQFKGDETKVVVSKKLFTKFLELNHDLNLFLLGRLDGNAKTWLTMERKKVEFAKSLVSPKKDLGMTIFLLLLSTGLCLLGYFVFKTDHGAGIILVLFGAIVLFFVFLGILFYTIALFIHKKAKKEKDSIQGKDFFMYGHDADDTRGVDEYDGLNVSFSFTNMPDCQRLIATAFSLGGKIGFIIRKDTSVDIDFNAHYLNCRGPVIPCIILKESIIFDIYYLQIIDGWILGEKPPLDTMTLSEKQLDESKHMIPKIELTPEMFI